MPMVGYFLEVRRKPIPGIFLFLSPVYLIGWFHPNSKNHDLSQGAIQESYLSIDCKRLKISFVKYDFVIWLILETNSVYWVSSNVCNRVFKWIFKWYFLENVFGHNLQENGFSPVWSLTCLFKSLPLLNAIGQWLQEYGFSPVWILKWILKWPFTENVWCTDHKEKNFQMYEFLSDCLNMI